MNLKFKTGISKIQREILRSDLREYTAKILMTPSEIEQLYDWVSKGNSVNCNPYQMTDETGTELDFISGIRTAEELAEVH